MTIPQPEPSVTFEEPTQDQAMAMLLAAGVKRVREWVESWQKVAPTLRDAGDVANALAAENAAEFFRRIVLIGEAECERLKHDPTATLNATD